EGAGVARRDGPARLEDRLEFGELLQRGIAPGALVCLDQGFGLAGPDRDRHDLIAEALLVLRSDGLLVAPQGEEVLALAEDIVLAGELFGPLHAIWGLVCEAGELDEAVGEVLGGHRQGVGESRVREPR